MKPQLTRTQKKACKSLSFIAIFMIATLAYSPVYGQNKKATSTEIPQNERIIKGIVTSEDGPVESASITLKGAKVGTVTNAKGEFTFPEPLKTGDVLLISYLGYETIAVKIKSNTTFVKQMLSEDLIEFVGALNSNKPYKSKRSN
ncbi:carboxypeptidase-like regulatory domain-containing protein [Gelatiniphilus marinus]|uniref:Carboxypeptidase-like regulatory domain-containing protein n=1 Tax=Gelatiniphilus marinus TaxID=1759464 RepID=A0ABW5JSN1_9FLAO